MFDRDGFWRFMEPYARSNSEVVFRLNVARGLACAAASGGAITTNCIDYEMTCLQVLVATEKLAQSIAALHGLADRELVFASEEPDWPIHRRAILPVPVDIKGSRYRLRTNDFIGVEEFRRLRDEARDALKLESLKAPEEAIPIDSVGCAADKLYDWLHSHMLIVPRFAGVAMFEHTDDQIACRLLSIDEIDWPDEARTGIEQ